MDSEKIEEKPPTEEIKLQAEKENATIAEPKKELIELTQEQKDKCKIIILILIYLLY